MPTSFLASRRSAVSLMFSCHEACHPPHPHRSHNSRFTVKGRCLGVHGPYSTGINPCACHYPVQRNAPLIDMDGRSIALLQQMVMCWTCVVWSPYRCAVGFCERFEKDVTKPPGLQRERCSSSI